MKRHFSARELENMMTRQQRVGNAVAVLRSLAEHLRERANDPDCSVPSDAVEVLYSAAGIVDCFGPVVAYELDKADEESETV